jgi:hypothetical protein
MKLLLVVAALAPLLACRASTAAPCGAVRLVADGGRVVLVNHGDRAAEDLVVHVGGREAGAAVRGHTARVAWLDAGEQRDLTTALQTPAGDRWRPVTMQATSAELAFAGGCHAEYAWH